MKPSHTKLAIALLVGVALVGCRDKSGNKTGEPTQPSMIWRSQFGRKPKTLAMRISAAPRKGLL